MEGDFDLTMLPEISEQAHILPNIKYSIVSTRSLCDSRCVVTFKTNDVIVVYKD